MCVYVAKKKKKYWLVYTQMVGDDHGILIIDEQREKKRNYLS